ncbi:hypothetical protein [Stanieria cyanosphaera]|uniref:hypothetical protein n=1 Tax=Stanieria cyanosphaera TaxID=102116 RepID=UPI0003026DF5|nr:hypothetical protein [Stanieria cyanosphaera]
MSVGFSGSRSPSAAASAALSALLRVVPSGVRVSVGCARGVDLLCRSFFAGSPSLLMFSVASGQFGSGRSAFARRSSRCVLSVAAGFRGLLVALPSAAVPPAGVRPSRSFFGGGSGSWGSLAFALGRGRRVLLWLPSGCLPPSWSGVSWSSAGALGAADGCWWLGVLVPVAPAPVQLSLF